MTQRNEGEGANDESSDNDLGDVTGFLQSLGKQNPEAVQRFVTWNVEDAARVTANQLGNENVHVKPDAEKKKSYLDQVRAARIAQLDADRDLQQKFFKFAAKLISVPVWVASGGFAWMVITGEMNQVIASAFFGSVVIEVIGLSLVLGKYLYPEGGKKPIDPKDEGL